MQTSKVVTMLAGVAALSGVANAGEVIGVSPVTSAGADFLAKGKDTVKVRFDGRTEFQYTTEDEDGFEFRRLRLGAKGYLGSKVYTETVLEMADAANNDGDDLEFDKAIIGYKVNDAFSVTGGWSKVVFGYEETSSSSTGKYIERSRLNDRLDGAGPGNFYDRQLNVTANLDLGGGFSAAASFADPRDGGDRDPAYFGRVRWANDNVTVGVDYADNNDYDAFTVYVNYEQGGFEILAEYFDADLAGLDVDGFAVRASYRFGDFEPVVRYSDYDWGSSSDEEILIGFNYYIAPQVTLLAAYRDVEEGGVDDDYLIGRLRVLW